MAETMTYQEMVAKAKSEWYTGSMKKEDVENFLNKIQEEWNPNWWVVNEEVNTTEPSTDLPVLNTDLSELTTSHTIDNSNRNIIELTTETLDVLKNSIWSVTKPEMKYFLDQDEIWIKNFDLPISILNIYSFYKWEALDENILTQIKEIISEEFGLSIYNWLDRWLITERLAKALNMQVFSFPLQSDLHDKIMELGIPYELTMWISDELVVESYNWTLDKNSYPMTTTKSYVWFNTSVSDTLNVFNTYWKRLDKNTFEIVNPTDLINNFNLSSKWYIFIPKEVLNENDKNYILLNQWLSPNWQSAMRRGMWDWKDPKGYATKDWIMANILYLKQKHKI